MKSIEELKKVNGGLLEDYSELLVKNRAMNINSSHELTGEGFEFVTKISKIRLLKGK